MKQKLPDGSAAAAVIVAQQMVAVKRGAVRPTPVAWLPSVASRERRKSRREQFANGELGRGPKLAPIAFLIGSLEFCTCNYDEAVRQSTLLLRTTESRLDTFPHGNMIRACLVLQLRPTYSMPSPSPVGDRLSSCLRGAGP